MAQGAAILKDGATTPVTIDQFAEFIMFAAKLALVFETFPPEHKNLPLLASVELIIILLIPRVKADGSQVWVAVGIPVVIIAPLIIPEINRGLVFVPQ